MARTHPEPLAAALVRLVYVVTQPLPELDLHAGDVVIVDRSQPGTMEVRRTVREQRPVPYNALLAHWHAGALALEHTDAAPGVTPLRPTSRAHAEERSA